MGGGATATRGGKEDDGRERKGRGVRPQIVAVGPEYIVTLLIIYTVSLLSIITVLRKNGAPAIRMRSFVGLI